MRVTYDDTTADLAAGLAGSALGGLTPAFARHLLRQRDGSSP